jgi:drug/metabolite transporter (DMT)-like permease
VQLIAAVVVTPLALGLHDHLSGSTRSWLLVLLLAVVPGGGHYLVNYAHAHVRLSLASLFNLVTPVAAMVSAALMLHERVTRLQVLGTAVVLAGMAVVLRQRAVEKEAAEGLSPGAEP